MLHLFLSDVTFTSPGGTCVPEIKALKPRLSFWEPVTRKGYIAEHRSPLNAYIFPFRDLFSST